MDNLNSFQERAKEGLKKNHTPQRRYGETFIVEPPIGDVRELSINSYQSQNVRLKAWNSLSEEDKQRIVSVNLDDSYLAWQVANMEKMGVELILLRKGEKKELKLKGGGLYFIVLEKKAELKVEDQILNLELVLRRMFVWQYEESKLSFTNLRAGNKFTNEQWRVELLEEGALVGINHLTYGRGGEQTDIKVVVNHKASNTESDLTVRTVAAEKSVNIYRGVISVDKGIKSMKGKENVKVLALSSRAVVDILPRLDVNSDNVQCDHEVGITQLNDEKLVYLRSRGLSEEEAKRLMILGFFKERFGFSVVVEKLLENMVNKGFNHELNL